MSNQLKKLQQGASQFLWPAFAAGLVVTGTGAMHEALQKKDPVGVAANSTALILVTAFAAYAKGVNQLRRDQELGIRDKDGDINITNKNFIVTEKRRGELINQGEALTVGAASMLVTTGFSMSVGASIALPIAAGLVLVAVGLTTDRRAKSLKEELTEAAKNIPPQEPDLQGNLSPQDMALNAALQRFRF